MGKAENVRRGRNNKRRGANYERELVQGFAQYGIKAKKVPLSGGTDFQKNDILVWANFPPQTVYEGEAKRRKALPKFFTEALDGADFAAFRQDHGETLIVLRLKTFAELLQ